MTSPTGLTPRDRALELMRTAAGQLDQQAWREGAENLVLAAELHREDGSAYDEARCLQMAASALRSNGDLAESRPLADRAAAIDHGDARLRVSILAEQAEGAFASNDWDAALPLISAAIASGASAGLGADGMNALLRRRARINLALGDLEAARADYDFATSLLDASVAGFVRTEQASALLEEGEIDEAERVVESIPVPVDPHLDSERLTIQAKIARFRGRQKEAIELADFARRRALEAVAPVTYFAASVELAEARSALGQFADAYGAMARAWATIGDLLGSEIASTWIEPCLIGFRIRWGDEAFDGAKKMYEAQRRRAQETA